MYDSQQQSAARPEEGTPIPSALYALGSAIERSEKLWDDLASRLVPLLSENEPAERDSPLRAANPATSALAMEILGHAGRIERLGDQLRQIRARLEL